MEESGLGNVGHRRIHSLIAFQFRTLYSNGEKEDIFIKIKKTRYKTVPTQCPPCWCKIKQSSFPRIPMFPNTCMLGIWCTKHGDNWLIMYPFQPDFLASYWYLYYRFAIKIVREVNIHMGASSYLFAECYSLTFHFA